MAVAAVGVDPAEVPPRVQEMWLVYSGGASLAVVALEFGIPAARVSALFMECGLPTRRGTSRPKPAAAGATPTAPVSDAKRVERAAAAAVRVREAWLLHSRAGVPLDEVARRYGVTTERLREVFEQARPRRNY